MILEMLTVGPFQENCYIIGDEQTGTGALVDPGDELPALRSRWSRRGSR